MMEPQPTVDLTLPEELLSTTLATFTTEVTPHRHNGRMILTIFKVVYTIGIIGNATAIIALRWGERRVRNRKHLLLLTSLAANDLVALVGMMGALVVSEHVPGAKNTQLYCAARVVLRVFGVGSVCIAVTMALERYLALTRPFLYQKQVTYFVIRMALVISWFWAAILTCAPIFGLGLYYDREKGQCTRYRNAVTNVDFAYGVFYVVFAILTCVAICVLGLFCDWEKGQCTRCRNVVTNVDFAYGVFYVVYGMLLCVVLVYCNLAVIQALYSITAPRAGGQPVVRRVSRSSCRQRSVNGKPSLHHNAATAEEVAFSRLMATLSVLFMICWLPNMITSALYLGLGQKHWQKLATLTYLSDMLMLLNYVLNPILYVLMRQRHTIYHTIAHCFKGSHKTSTESMTLKNSCCPQDTLVVSDCSGVEMRPLRSLPPPPPYQDTPLVKIED